VFVSLLLGAVSSILMFFVASRKAAGAQKEQVFVAPRRERRGLGPLVGRNAAELKKDVSDQY
jgi:hypothetical protein